MEPVLSPPFSLRQLSAALLTGSIALLMLGLQPILLGELVDRHLITMEGVGIVAMGEIITLGLGVVLGDALLPLARYRLIAVLAAVATVALDVVTASLAGDGPLTGVRAAAGLSEGVLVWVTTSVIVRAWKPDRMAAIFMVVQTLSQTGAAALLAVYVVPAGGWQAGFQALALVSLLPCLLAYFMPPELKPLRAEHAPAMRWTIGAALPLAIAFLQMAAIGSLWAYLEPLGLAVGFDARGAQAVISLVLAMQVVGGSVAIFAVRRLPPKLVLIAGSMLLAVIAFAVFQLPVGSQTTFAVLLALFGFTWLFVMPFQIGMAFAVDPSGRVAVLVPAMQLLGSAIGPLIASFTVEGDAAGPVPLVSGLFALVAAAAPLMATRRRQCEARA